MFFVPPAADVEEQLLWIQVRECILAKRFELLTDEIRQFWFVDILLRLNPEESRALGY
ncbi:hypothetical protein SAMN05192552_105115 [Natrinema hispanicum]|uniref:Uncharacterized protein n=1 Tax=Natrinema hispanicum TaxID=392421 RepID=A0A1G6XSL4_9EURY|nr:hypothetical protein SAMN05192552_105115 [Natrinema hispanicum]SET97386.1 hypothetical protein SAMN04488694_1222 [Natrinema hispanicum]